MNSDTNLHDTDQRIAAPDTAWQDDVRAGVRHVRDLASLPLSPAERAAAQEAAVRHKVRIPKSLSRPDRLERPRRSDPRAGHPVAGGTGGSGRRARRSDRRPCLQPGAAIDASPCRPGAVVPDLSMRGLLPLLLSQGVADLDRPRLYARGAGGGLCLYRSSPRNPRGDPDRRRSAVAAGQGAGRNPRPHRGDRACAAAAHPHARACRAALAHHAGAGRRLAGPADGHRRHPFQPRAGDHVGHRRWPAAPCGRQASCCSTRASCSRASTTRSRCWKSSAAS